MVRAQERARVLHRECEPQEPATVEANGVGLPVRGYPVPSLHARTREVSLGDRFALLLGVHSPAGRTPVHFHSASAVGLSGAFATWTTS